MTCDEFLNRLDDVLDRRMSPADDRSLTLHARMCAHCQKSLSTYQSLLHTVPHLPTPVAPPELLHGLRGMVAGPLTPSSFKGRLVQALQNWKTWGLVAAACAVIAAGAMMNQRTDAPADRFAASSTSETGSNEPNPNEVANQDPGLASQAEGGTAPTDGLASRTGDANLGIGWVTSELKTSAQSFAKETGDGIADMEVLLPDMSRKQGRRRGSTLGLTGLTGGGGWTSFFGVGKQKETAEPSDGQPK